jgi:carbonic anhydrase/acetyltransferase-like protein (isoleucine patch superfamily)
MTTFAVTNSDQLLPAVNYLLSNLDTQTVQGNITIPGNVLVANTTTGVVSQSGNSTPFAYLYQYVNLRYSNNATGTDGFDTTSNNFSYFGVFNSTGPTPSSNPASYQWYEVDPPFDTATLRTLYYSAIGGRQIQWAAASSPPSSNYVITVANVAIDLDVVTTAAGTPGERGPVVMAAVITTADPNTATAATLTGWFEAPRDANTAPIGTGLIPPVVGDTASFTWAAGAGQPQAAYEYNGSIWLPVNGQVVSGNVIVRGTIAGNAMIANTITATQIATGTITATQIAANTITAGQIAANTITSGQIAANTITGNNIAAGTITTDNFTANTIQGNIIAAGTITAEQLAANAITANTVVSSGAVLGSNASLGFWLDGTTGNARFGNNLSIGSSVTIGTVISGGQLAPNSVGATQIINGSITTQKFTANTINGNIISAGTITAEQLSANAIIANTVVSSGATFNSNTSPGYWLNGTTGNARFGNSLSIGNLLSVGSNANIGTNLTVGANANIGTNLIVGSGANIGTNLIVGSGANIGTNLIVGSGANIGTNLIVGANATVGANLIVGSNANIGTGLRVGNSAIIGNSVSIGTNLTVGANANIGGNLFVSGLITGGGLNSNTVITTTMVPQAVSDGLALSASTFQQIGNSIPQFTIVATDLQLNLTTGVANQPVYLYSGLTALLEFTCTTACEIRYSGILQRGLGGIPGSSPLLYNLVLDQNSFVVAPGAGSYQVFLNSNWTGYLDQPPIAGNWYYQVGVYWVALSGTVTNMKIQPYVRNLTLQTLKR